MKDDSGLNWWNLIIFGPVIVLLAVLWTLKLSYPHSDIRVIDGDTLEIGGTTYRLWGVAARDTVQSCQTNGPGPLFVAVCSLVPDRPYSTTVNALRPTML